MAHIAAPYGVCIKEKAPLSGAFTLGIYALAAVAKKQSPAPILLIEG